MENSILINEMAKLHFTNAEIELVFTMMKNNPSCNLAYHNSNHCINMGIMAKDLAKSENTEISLHLLRAVFLAGIFHDFAHSGDASLPDSENITKAVKFAKEMSDLFSESIMDFRVVIALILATEQMSQSRTLSEILSLAEFSEKEIEAFYDFETLAYAIQDADYMEYFLPDGSNFENRVREYQNEVGGDVITLEGTIKYLNAVKFKTRLAQEISENVLSKLS